MTVKPLFFFVEPGNKNKKPKNNPAPDSDTANHLLERLPTPDSQDTEVLENCVFGVLKSNFALASLTTWVGLPQRSNVFHGTETQHMVLHVHIISLNTTVYFGACASAAVGGKMHISVYHPLAATSHPNCWLLPYHLSIDLVNFLVFTFNYAFI